MIIDCYPSAFAQWDSPAGYRSFEEKLRVIQRELGVHHQPVWRVRDGAPADNSSLIDPVTSELRGVKWIRHNNQLAWVYRGETYTKQYFPPMLNNLEYPAELMIAEMDYVGVDSGILHTHPHKGTYRFQNELHRHVVNHFPDRFMRLIMVDAAAIPRDPEAAAQELNNEVSNPGRVGLQFIPRYYYRPAVESEKGNDEPWDDGAMRPFWEAATALRIPVFFTMLGRGGAAVSITDQSSHETYVDELRVLMRWMDRYPDITVVITHGLPWRRYFENDRIRFPEEIWEVFQYPQCNMELVIPIQMGGLWEYPWKEAEPTIRECVERIGADRLMWGSDWPMVGRFCTYRQALDQYRGHCGFLTDDQRQAILGGTAARVMGIADDDDSAVRRKP